jgi:6-phosphogluconolactonase (cycloisomerase 2 family)
VIPAVPLAGGPIFHPTALQANATGSLLFASGQTSQAVYPPAYDSAVMPIEISNGVLTLGAPLVVTGGNSTGVAVDPQGDVVFTANTAPTGAGQLAAFTYASGTGALTAASSVGQGTTGGPVSLAIDPTGTFAYCVDTTDSTVQVFGVDTGGFVAGFTSSPVVNPAAPNCVILDPAGQCLYTGNANGTVSAYSIPTPGHLTYVSTTSVEPAHSILTAKVQSLAIDPTGSYIVTANGTSDDVSMLSVSRSSTAPAIVLTLTGTPYSIASATAAVAPVSVTYNANGMTVYVANSAANSISALIVNSTGLAPLPGSPFALPAGDTTPCAVAVSQ